MTWPGPMPNGYISPLHWRQEPSFQIPNPEPSNSPMAKEPKNTNPRPRRAVARAAAQQPPPGGDIEDFPPGGAAAIRAALLRWYDAHRRELPWRAASAGDRVAEAEERAYAVWVSEMMLQQTRVPVVVGYYGRWMERWPTVRRLAAATQEEVNEMWAGLGYYRRARFLLEGAKQIVKEGEFPRTASALRGVAGIGDYTAGAIASIAFNEVVPVVDGNVVRVISRLKAIAENPKESSTVKRFWKLAGQLVDPSRPGDFNQAMMELGATLCSKAKPDCSQCPISSHCQALSLSKEDTSVEVTNFPRQVPKAKPRHDFAAVCVVQVAQSLEQETITVKNTHNHFLLIKRPEEGLLAGLWEFPSVLVDETKTDTTTRRKEMDKYLRKLLNVDVKRKCHVVLREDVGEHIHVFSHIRLTMHVELMILDLNDQLCKGQEKGNTTWKFVDESSVDSMGLTSGIRKVYNMVKAFKEKRPREHTRTPRKRTRQLKS